MHWVINDYKKKASKSFIEILQSSKQKVRQNNQLRILKENRGKPIIHVLNASLQQISLL